MKLAFRKRQQLAENRPEMKYFTLADEKVTISKSKFDFNHTKPETKAPYRYRSGAVYTG